MTCPLSEPLALGGTCDLCWTAPACDLRAATDAEHDRTRAARDARILEAAMAKREDDPWAGYEEPEESEKPSGVEGHAKAGSAQPAAPIVGAAPGSAPDRRRRGAGVEPGLGFSDQSGPALELEAESREALEKPIERGDEVRVVKGRKVPIGTKGRVFWLGDGAYGRRCGFKDARGEVHWTALENVQRHVVQPMTHAQAVVEQGRDDRARQAELLAGVTDVFA